IPALACAAAAEIGLGKTPAGAHVLALMVAGAITVLILAPTVMLFFFALGLARAYAPALFATLLGLALLPILDWLYPVIHERRTKWISLRTATPSLTGVAVMLLSVLVGLGVDRFDRDHPQPAELMYILDADTYTAYWGSRDSEIGGWTGKFVAGRAG